MSEKRPDDVHMGVDQACDINIDHPSPYYYPVLLSLLLLDLDLALPVHDLAETNDDSCTLPRCLVITNYHQVVASHTICDDVLDPFTIVYALIRPCDLAIGLYGRLPSWLLFRPS